MNLGLVEKIANAVLYEGYILYPYRASAVKNRQRWNFGALYPRAFSLAQGHATESVDAWTMQTECLVKTSDHASVDVKIRFLHLLAREIVDARNQVVESLEVGGQIFQTWQEAVERDVDISNIRLSELASNHLKQPFTFPASRETEPINDAAGVIVRSQQAIEGAVEVAAEAVNDQLFKVTVRIMNLTPIEDEIVGSRDESLMRALVSTHTILSIRGGEFISLLEPPEALAELTASCRNVGTWPVLAGDAEARDCMLSSPIILYDYPQIAPESAGELFDSTEIDEILTLRILTLTDEEKREMRGVDERARRILERTETMPHEQLMKLHGTVRGLRPVSEDER